VSRTDKIDAVAAAVAFRTERLMLRVRLYAKEIQALVKESYERQTSVDMRPSRSKPGVWESMMVTSAALLVFILLCILAFPQQAAKQTH
jgi:hypothetical protein